MQTPTSANLATASSIDTQNDPPGVEAANASPLLVVICRLQVVRVEAGVRLRNTIL